MHTYNEEKRSSILAFTREAEEVVGEAVDVHVARTAPGVPWYMVALPLAVSPYNARSTNSNGIVTQDDKWITLPVGEKMDVDGDASVAEITFDERGRWNITNLRPSTALSC